MKRRHADKSRIDLESPLGLTDEPIVTTPSDHLEGGDPASRRRRARALGEDGIERPTSGLDVDESEGGATGIDMGYGGEGTGIKRTT